MDRYRIAKEFASDLKQRFGDSITSIILFGSVAREKETKESDIDLLVVSRGHIFKDLKAPIARILEHNIVPEIINLSVSEFDEMKHRGGPFYIKIKKEGIKLA